MVDPELAMIDEPPSRVSLAFARFVLRYRWPLLLGTLALVAGSLYAIATRIRVDTSIEAFADSQSESQVVLEALRDEFGADQAHMVLIKGDVFSLGYLNKLKALHEELERLDMDVPSLGQRKADRDKLRRGEVIEKKEKKKAEDGFDAFAGGDEWGEEKGGSIVVETLSLINARRTRSSAEGIAVGELMDPFPTEADLPALKALVLADTTLVGNLVGKAGGHSVILVRTEFMSEEDGARVSRELFAIAQKHAAPGFEPMIAGMHAMSDALQTHMMYDLRMMLALSVGVMIVILGFLFRHPLAIAVPLLVVMFSAANTFGLMALTGVQVTMLSNILPAFLFCVGLGDSIHIVSLFRDARKLGMDAPAATLHAMGHTGVPVLFTSLTTMAGLASFKFSSMTAIQDMGMYGAFGVGMALIHSLVFLPIMLSFVKKARFGAPAEHKEDWLDRVLAACVHASGIQGDTGRGPRPGRARRRLFATLAVGGVVMAIAGFGASQMRVYHNPLTWMPDSTPIKTTTAEMDDHVGGTATVSFLIDAAPGKDLKDRDLLVGMEALRKHISEYVDPVQGAIVGNAISLVDVVKETNRALHGGEQAHYVIPDTQRGVTDALFLFENAGPDELRKLATNDLSRTQLTIRIKWLEALSYQPLIDHIEKGVKEHMPSDVRVQPTGSVYTLLTTVGGLIQNLVSSFGSALLLITIFMAILLRSVRFGLIAMVPNLVPILCIMGIMGFADIPIDLNNLLIASIAIGIAVDDTIHYMHHARLHYVRSGNAEEAIEYAMRTCGRAMVSTTVILVLGFASYLGASMINLQRFGLLISLTSFLALVADLFFSPAMLRLFFKRLPEKEKVHAP